MTVTITSQTALGPSMVKLDFSSTLPTPTFYIWVNGELVGTTQDTEHIMFAPPGKYLDVDIFDDSGDAPGDSYPDTITLQWVSQGGVTDWVIKQRTTAGGAETQIRKLKDNDGVMTAEIGSLDDDQDYWFAVYGYSAEGVVATKRDFTFHNVRRPDLDASDVTYDSGTAKLTFSEPA